jgi:hypothetical protein
LGEKELRQENLSDDINTCKMQDEAHKLKRKYVSYYFWCWSHDRFLRNGCGNDKAFHKMA